MSLQRISAAIVLLLLASMVQAAPQATLYVAPGLEVKANDVLSFSLIVPYQTPAPTVSVQQLGAPWKSEMVNVVFPAPNQPATVKFTKTFTVPGSALLGASFYFLAVGGGSDLVAKPPISDRVCVTVGPKFQVYKPITANPGGMDTLHPDLIIVGVSYNHPDMYTSLVHVRNQGKSSSPACQLTLTRSYFDQPEVKTAAVPPLGPGAEAWVSVTSTKPLGQNCNCKMAFKVDSADTVKESDETNNTMTFDNIIR